MRDGARSNANIGALCTVSAHSAEIADKRNEQGGAAAPPCNTKVVGL